VRPGTQLAKLLSPGQGLPALATAPGAHHYRLVALELAPATPDALIYDLVRLGEGGAAQDTLADVPHHLVLDRLYVHGTKEGELKRGIALNSATTTIRDSTVLECKGKGYDTQAIAGWNGPGPFVIEGNRLEGAGENLMFGGADPAIPQLVPVDITIRRNLLRKPFAWRGRWTVKNLLELKSARRVTIDGNVLENNWADGQNGAAVLFTVRNQDGAAPWSVVEQVRFSNNVVRRSGAALNVLGRDDNHPSERANRINVGNNLFVDIDGKRYGGAGTFLTVTDVAGMSLRHNTVLQTGNITSAYGAPSVGFMFTDSIVRHNLYGVHGDSTGTGKTSLARYFPGSLFAGNALVGGTASLYPSGNRFPRSVSALGFAPGSYALSVKSPYRRAATDGRALGIDAVALRRALGPRLAPAADRP
jgi:hypothetical protein